MKQASNIYLGKIINTENFRAYIYNTEGSKKLIESWRDFENHMATGLWFPKKSEVLEMQKIKKKQESNPKRKRNQKIEEIKSVEYAEENKEFISEKFGFEVNTEH